VVGNNVDHVIPHRGNEEGVGEALSSNWTKLTTCGGFLPASTFIRIGVANCLRHRACDSLPVFPCGIAHKALNLDFF
jgi:hypothetical protein